MKPAEDLKKEHEANTPWQTAACRRQRRRALRR